MADPNNKVTYEKVAELVKSGQMTGRDASELIEREVDNIINRAEEGSLTPVNSE